MRETKKEHSEGGLLPCPFCGGESAYMSPPTCRPETPYNPSHRLYPMVRCRDCGALVDGENEDYRGNTAIAAWNRRTRIAAEPTMYGALREAEAVLQGTVNAGRDTSMDRHALARVRAALATATPSPNASPESTED